MPDAKPRKRRSTGHRFGIVLLVVWGSFGTGCAAVPYNYGHIRSSEQQPADPEFEYGRPQKALDRLAWATGIWSRLLTCNPNVNNHELSDETREKLVTYLAENDLNDVLIRVNQYDPRGEWRRLRQNQLISPGWRYSVGMLSLAQYTLLPGRVFGGDEYNAFTNTLYINSDVPAVVLHEAAYAKDIHSRSLPGTYAFVNEIPFLGVWRHTNGINDILGYAQTTDDWPIEQETYRVVYPQMGIYSTAFSGSFVPFWDGLLLTAAGAVAGHVTGQVAISQRSSQRQSDIDHSAEEIDTAGYSSIHAMKGATVQFAKHESDSLRRD